MVKKILIYRIKEVFLAFVVLAVMAGTSNGAVYNLRADATTKTIDGVLIPMWGFGLNGGPVTVPGPVLEVPPGDTTLTINLTNSLSVPVSIVIPGQSITPTPTYVDGRVMSFTTEAAANGGTATYTWTNLKPGTYLYKSGTNPAVQVQMGLYGVVKKDFAVGLVYNNANAAYDNEVVLLFSAIDPVIHGHVAGGTYGTPPPTGIISTIDYWPRYFLINGEPYSGTSFLAGNVGENTLVRFLSAGLQTYVPMFLGSHLNIIAEDGNLLPYPKHQYSLNLAAGKTVDVIFAPQAPGTYPVLDRRLNLTNAGLPGGGMLAKLQVGGNITAPIANDDSYEISKNTTLNVPAPGVLGNDTGPGTLTAVLVSGPGSGGLTLNPNGSFTYTPSTDFVGLDTFTYKANNGTDSEIATVTINVVDNTAPTAVNDEYSVDEDNTLDVAAPGVLGNDTDPENNPLTAILVSMPMNGTLTLSSNGSFTYKPNTNYFGMDSFTYKANDGLADSNMATVEITINSVNDPPVALDDFASTSKNTPVTINVIANDYDIDGTVNPASVTVVNQPTRGGTVSVQSNGTIIFTPKKNFRGTDVFTYTVKDNEGAPSNLATVRVNVL